MNRKNLTAAVLAGLAGAAGLAGTAQAVNMNPDGLGQVLIYPYYTANDGNQTVLSVVNTTGNAKAVKVRFLEGYNSREVLDFNLYLSEYDVWTAAVHDLDGDGVPGMSTNDTSCTVPYFNAPVDDEGTFVGGHQDFLNLAYIDNGGAFDFTDGGPTEILRAAEGHFEIIEMGTVVEGTATETEITHGPQVKKDKDGNTVASWWAPNDCGALVTKWTRNEDGSAFGQWTKDVDATGGYPLGYGSTHMTRNSGGLFGGAAVVNGENGTMFSYDALAIQGYDKSEARRHNEPGTIHPSLNDGSEQDAWVFFGVPQNKATKLSYNRPVDAISAIFMHENIMNEYTLETIAGASTEWIVTMPTKSFYVDDAILYAKGEFIRTWIPDASDAVACDGWTAGDPNPLNAAEYQCTVGFTNNQPAGESQGSVLSALCGGDNPAWDGDLVDNPNKERPDGYANCNFIFSDKTGALKPFAEVFDGESCDAVDLATWDREEGPPGSTPGQPGKKPPVVSPSLPTPPSTPSTAPFELCYEVNVIRMLDDVESDGGVVFGTPTIDGDTLLVKAAPGADAGWARINLYSLDKATHHDENGLVGLPATGFAAQEFENESLGGGTVKAFYGGLYSHKGNVKRVALDD